MYAQDRGGYCSFNNNTLEVDVFTEGVQNCIEIANILMTNYGWSLNAVCGFLGNVAYESGLNPWRYQGDGVQSVTSAQTWGDGYGFAQWTPCRKYLGNSNATGLTGYAPNYSDQVGNSSDGIAQLEFLNNTHSGEWIDSQQYPNVTWDDFIVSTESAETCADMFLRGYERGTPHWSRQAFAKYIYEEIFGGQPPQPPTPTRSRKLKIWQYPQFNNKYIVQRRLM